MADRNPNTTFREPDSSIIPHVSLFVCQLIALASPPFRGRRFLFSTLIILLGIQAHLRPHFTNNVGLAQPFTIAWSYYMATLAKLLFSNEPGPESDYWRIDKPAREALAYTGFLWKKSVWAVMLVFNQRGIRWNHQVKNVPKLGGQTRRRFLVSQASNFVKYMLVADLLFELSRRLFFTSSDGLVGQVNSKYLSLRAESFAWSFPKAFIFGATPYFMLSMQYSQFAFIAVLLGLSKPEDWPAPFGRLGDTTTIRDFWGRFWHQQLRHMLTSYADSFADALRIPRGTNLSSYTKLYLSFFISGAFHALSQLQMPCPINISVSDRTTGFFLFFVWQAAFITFEDFVQWLVRKTAWGPLKKEGGVLRVWIGYLWVIVALWMTIPLVGDTFLRMRMGIESLLPFSWSRPLVERFIPIPP
ncbi:toxin biosynthesis protein [Glonium stellatum]|uniref:Toxin biosynthesis protein n=1 Tax=Glonium stellatum TaxID=574774 RepID=A0A8E2JZH4_9PEZI|nr:toxin biosynthesis protein [Glonium stellatum]